MGVTELFFDIGHGYLVTEAGGDKPLRRVRGKAGDAMEVRLRLFEDGEEIFPDNLTELVLVVKDSFAEGAEPLASVTTGAWEEESGSGSEEVGGYSATLITNTVALRDALASSEDGILNIEVTVTFDERGPFSSANAIFAVENDLWKGDESSPLPLPEPQEWLKENLPIVISGADEKTTPADGDRIPMTDSEDGFSLKWLSWANLKATAKAYFDTVYAAISHTHVSSQVTDAVSSISGASKLLKTNASGVLSIEPPGTTGNYRVFIGSDSMAFAIGYSYDLSNMALVQGSDNNPGNYVFDLLLAGEEVRLSGNGTWTLGTGTAASLLSAIGALSASDGSVTNSREWTADTVSQSEAEAGTATTRRAWTAQRVFQAFTSFIGTWFSSNSSTGGNGAPDAGKALKFGSGGQSGVVPRVVSSNATAQVGDFITVTAASTISDPVATYNGASYVVRAVSGTATVGGVAYPVGTVVFRYYSSGDDEWFSIVYDSINQAATLTNKTLPNPTITDYTESVVSIGNSGTSQTLSLTNGTFQTVTLTGNCTFTMPTATAGKSFMLKVLTGAGGFTATFTGVKWPGDTTPTITATASKYDLVSFVADGSSWSGSILQNYTA